MPVTCLFLINRRSGRQATDYEGMISAFCREKSIESRFLILDEGLSLQAARQVLVNPGAQTVVAVGGDGTVRFAVQMVLGTSASVAIVPAGSANGMAKELGIPLDTRLALEAVFNGVITQCDVVRLGTGEICVHMSDAGLNARLVKYFQQGSVRGKLGYFLALLKALTGVRRMRVDVQTRTASVSRVAVSVVIANASRYGTGAVINPRGEINDGLFEVVIVRKLGLGSILRMFLHYGSFHPRKIEIIQARRVTITGRHRMHFQADGEYIGKLREVDASIMPGAFSMIVPVAAGARG